MKGIAAKLAPLALFAALAGAPHADEAMAPDALVRDTAQRVLAALDGRRDELQAYPEQVQEIVDRLLLPHFDLDYAGRVVLGQHGRTATPEQRKRFVEAFYRSLVRTYAAGLLEFTTDTMRVLPWRGEPDAERTRVRTEVVLDDGTKVPVDYSLRRTDAGWKVYDVAVEGISYVTNYRKMVTAEISRKGIDGLIAQLEQGTLPAAAASDADKAEGS
jgi:phospholipid transport system substrate-binding protein